MKQAWPQVQVALDLVDLKEAVRIARLAVSAGVGWVEAGTPLIKSEGMRAVRVLSREFRRNIVIADMKTLDAGTVESEMAFQAGAKVVSISGIAHDRTISDSVKVASRYNRWLMADLLMSPDPQKRAPQLETLGVDIICLHTGIDAQKALHSKLKVSRTVRDLTQALKIPVAAAGGITPDVVEGLVRSGVKIIIVGGWITGSRDPAKASSKLMEKVRDLRRSGPV